MTIASKTRGSHLLRQGRISVPQHTYLITFITHDRRPSFHDWELACLAARIFSKNTTWGDAKLLSWVLMPDHFHGLIQLGDAENLSNVVKQAKGRTALLINRQRLRSGNLWMNGFHDHAIRKDEDLLSVARYMLLNPVRAGIAKRCGAYPFWDAIWI